ncbi:MAG: PQQ-binding-like beta-propeller repeat protein [Oscillospiraceae bacterium]|nr:PQQ-binding-like beta-propeller repeat protein [Oscillospiraceae bacterium]
MPNQYDAFISYRHHPVDSAVAEKIQKSLEHFHIPRSLRKSTGTARISRICRDKAELAITSDINEDIIEALENSRYLIVICSTHTAESLWVQREIEIFLRNHSRRQVLTVLVDGEPKDVIPAILCSETQSFTTETGETVTRTVPVEPLSCDFRGKKSVIRKEELPRLAAAIIGCPYDALRQRQRQYQMRRLAAAFSAGIVLMAALAAYFLWSSMQIRENYEQSLRSQSQYLASESLALGESGDRLAAIELALAALPSEERERPLVAEAEYALAMASGTYIPPGSGKMMAVCTFDHADTVVDFFVDQAGERLFVLDMSNTVTIWDKNTYAQIHSKTFSETVDSIVLTPDDLLIVSSDSWIAAYDSRSGENIWIRLIEDYGWWGSDAPVLSPDGKTLLVQRRSYADVESHDLLALLDAATGETVREIDFSSAEFDEINMLSPCISEDGRYFAFYDLWFDEEYNNWYYAAVCDLESGSVMRLPQDYVYIEDICFTPGGDLVVQGDLEDIDGSERFGNNTTIRTDDVGLWCFDIESGDMRWEAAYTVSAIPLITEIMPVRYADETGKPVEAVLSVNGDICAVCEAHSGEILWNMQLPAPIAYVDSSDNGAYWVLENGMLANASFALEEIYCVPYFQNNLLRAYVQNGCITQQRGASELVLYYSGIYDEAWRLIEDSSSDSYIYETLQSGNWLVVRDSKNTLMLMDMETAACVCTVILEGEQYSYELLGVTPDGGEVVLVCETYVETETVREFVRISTADGSVTRQPFVMPENAVWTETDYLLLDGGVIYGYYDWESRTLCEAAFDGTLKRQVLLPDEWIIGDAISLSPDGSKVLLHASDTQMGIADLNEGTALLTESTSSGKTYEICAAWSPDGNYVAHLSQVGVAVCTMDGALVAEVDTGAVDPLSLFFADENTLLVVLSDGTLLRHAVPDGTLLGRTALAYVDGLNGRWTYADEETLVFVSGLFANIIATDTWTLRGSLNNCCGYYPQLDCFAVESYKSGTYEFGIFRRYSVAELIEKGRAQLGDTELSEEKQVQYGLTD